jgi:hypothetical protein
MTNNSSPTPKDNRLRLKQSAGWFPADDSFVKALTVLSDGAFKFFTFLCLKANRRTGQHQATQRELAVRLGKSRRIIGSYIAELQERGICKVQLARNQYGRTIFKICDDYWPHERNPGSGPTLSDSSGATKPSRQECHSLDSTAAHSEENSKHAEMYYVEAIRQDFVSVGCTRGIFRSSDESIARTFYKRGVSLSVVQDALVLGACRKYISWLNTGASEPIGSLAYFAPLVNEVQQRPFPPGYREHMRYELQKLSGLWNQSVGKSRPKRGYHVMASSEIGP